jgi:hypothetical protein
MKKTRPLSGVLLAIAASTLSSCSDAGGAPSGTGSGKITEPTSTDCSPLECAEVVAQGGYYVAGSASCQGRAFSCGADERRFINECGCGCVPTFCPKPEEVASAGYSSWTATEGSVCALVDFLCDSDQVYVCNDCGWGCKRRPECPITSDPNVRYSSHDLDACAATPPSCGPNETPFSGKCGCGCQKGRLERPALTAEACAATGGKVVGDIGNGAVHHPDYRCPSGAAPSGSIVTAEGRPWGIEGAVCCPQ